MPNSFRFGVVAASASSRQQWQQRARDLEALGYDILLVPDHLHDQLSPLPAALSAAEATTQLRVGTFVCAAGLRHPVILAKEAATLGVLTEGRFELGLGVGWMVQDYHALNLDFGSPGIRAGRFVQTLETVKSLLAQASADCGIPAGQNGADSFDPTLSPAQIVPVLAGGGGKRVLTAAALHADIVSFSMRSKLDGSGLDPTTAVPDMLASQVQWVEEAAANRATPPERNLLLQAAIIGPRNAAVEQASKMFGIPEELALQTPHLAVGSPEEIAESLLARRQQFGISYLAVFDLYAESFAAVMNRLAA